jgi:hypothetical protein
MVILMLGTFKNFHTNLVLVRGPRFFWYLKFYQADQANARISYSLMRDGGFEIGTDLQKTKLFISSGRTLQNCEAHT